MQPVYLVTGAAGHLGNTIVQGLLKRGARVRALVLPGEAAAARMILGSEPELVTGDVCDKAGLGPFFKSLDGAPLYVIHAAGIVSICAAQDPRVYHVNVNGTRNVVELCIQHDVAKLIYISSVHAIPERPHGETMQEVPRFDPDKVTGLYAKTKAAATQIVLDAARQGLNACVVHPSGIIGPYDYGRGHSTQLILDYMEGRLGACVRGGYDFVDVRDVADGVIACCEHGGRGECYILSNRYYPVRELLDDLYKLTGLRKIRVVLPVWFVKLTAPLAELYYRLLKQPPLFTRYSVCTLQSNARFSNAKAAVELDFRPRPIVQSLADTVQWLRDQGRLPRSPHKTKRRARRCACAQ